MGCKETVKIFLDASMYSAQVLVNMAQHSNE